MFSINITECMQFRSLDAFVEYLLGKVREILNSRQAAIFLRDFDKDIFTMIYFRSATTTTSDEATTAAVSDLPCIKMAKKSLPIDENTFAGRCVVQGEPIISNEPLIDPLYSPEIDDFAGKAPENLIALPILRYGKVEAVIIAIDRPGGFNEDQAVDIAGFLRDIPFLLEFVGLKEDQDKFAILNEELVTVATDIITPEGKGHVLRVAELCRELAECLDFSEIAKYLLWHAAIYHDIGKILLAGREPWEIDRYHTVEGANYLRRNRLLERYSDLVETSHERFDGTGFPKGIGGDSLSISSWILALAEDIEEFNFEERARLFQDMIANFYLRKAESHHPLVIEALTSLINSGKLEKIVRG